MRTSMDGRDCAQPMALRSEDSTLNLIWTIFRTTLPPPPLSLCPFYFLLFTSPADWGFAFCLFNWSQCPPSHYTMKRSGSLPRINGNGEGGMKRAPSMLNLDLEALPKPIRPPAEVISLWKQFQVRLACCGSFPISFLRSTNAAAIRCAEEHF